MSKKEAKEKTPGNIINSDDYDTIEHNRGSWNEALGTFAENEEQRGA